MLHARILMRSPVHLARGLSTKASNLNTVVLTGSTRTKQIGSRVSQYLCQQLDDRGSHDVTVLDPRTHQDGYFMSLMDKAYFHYKVL